jgi:apoptosis-inducing factor 3
MRQKSSADSVCWRVVFARQHYLDSTIWHHACFSLRTGGALRAPGLDPVSSWKVETNDGKLFVREKQSEKKPPRKAAKAPENVIIVGGGAAGNAAAAD